MSTTDLAHPPSAPPALHRRALPMALHRWPWVPILSLTPRHRPHIQAHLLALDAHDRYLRFGYPANDQQIVRYLDTLDFERDEVFGIFNRRLELIAMAHLAYAVGEADDADAPQAEFGVSVLAHARGHGYGGRLFEHAVLHARNRCIDTLLVHALSQNTPMLRIASGAGATVQRCGSDAEASLKLPSETLLTRFEELVEWQAAELDYRLKAQAHRIHGMLESLSEVKSTHRPRLTATQ